MQISTSATETGRSQRRTVCINSGTFMALVFVAVAALQCVIVAAEGENVFFGPRYQRRDHGPSGFYTTRFGKRSGSSPSAAAVVPPAAIRDMGNMDYLLRGSFPPGLAALTDSKNIARPEGFQHSGSTIKGVNERGQSVSCSFAGSKHFYFCTLTPQDEEDLWINTNRKSFWVNKQTKKCIRDFFLPFIF